MGKDDYRVVRRNKTILDIAFKQMEDEKRKKRIAAEKAEKVASIEYKTGIEQRKCIHILHDLESEYKKACAAKEPNLEKVEDLKNKLLSALDKSAIDSLGRILAEIKQVSLDSKELLTVDISEEVFYKDFKNFCEKNFVEYSITDEEITKILRPYTRQNLIRIKSLGGLFGYEKPGEKLEENIEIVKNTLTKEKEMTI